MQIDKCPHSQYCGDKSGDNAKDKQIWYCPRFGNKEWCPYDKCETPSKVINMPKPVEPMKLKEEMPIDGVINRQVDKQEKYLRLFEEAKKLEAEGMLACEAIVILKTTQYALKRLEQIFNYRFNWLSRNIDWSLYDERVIAMKKQKKSYRLIAEELGISEAAVNKRWQTELKGR